MNLNEKIFDYCMRIDGILKDAQTTEELKKRIVDSIFVSYGARNSEAVKISKQALLPSSGPLNSRIYFEKTEAAVDVATYLNGCMTRYLDYNDTYLSKEALHPSDNIPPILSVAYAEDIEGREVLRGVAAAYQIVGAFADAFSIRDRGWDHVTYISISAAVGIATLLSFERDKFINTLSLAINNNISLRQTRAGELSMWKGCTAANASRNSVFAALLASRGFTGPSPIFEGEMGFFKQVTGNINIDLERNRILKTMIKSYPVEYHAMSAVDAALALEEEVSYEEIKSITVETFSVAHKIIVKDPEKLRPKTKETADHSMPYIIAYTLVNGKPAINSFEKKHLEDKRILDLIDRMKFVVSDEYDSLYPEYLPIKITVRTSSGEYEREVKYPKGHFRDPFTWDDLENKGKSLMDKDAVNEIIKAGKNLDSMSTKDFVDVISGATDKKMR
ncbi:MAG: MmgE/PrpD family protein [Thermoplasmatales archaeon]